MRVLLTGCFRMLQSLQLMYCMIVVGWIYSRGRQNLGCRPNPARELHQSGPWRFDHFNFKSSPCAPAKCTKRWVIVLLCLVAHWWSTLNGSLILVDAVWLPYTWPVWSLVQLHWDIFGEVWTKLEQSWLVFSCLARGKFVMGLSSPRPQKVCRPLVYSFNSIRVDLNMLINMFN